MPYSRCCKPAVAIRCSINPSVINSTSAKNKTLNRFLATPVTEYFFTGTSRSTELLLPPCNLLYKQRCQHN